MVNYIPKQKDIIYADFSPVKGHEQGKYRPAIVLSLDVFNKNTNMILCCPISSNIKQFPTHYELIDSKKINGSVFLEHLRSFDYQERNIKFIEKCSNRDFENIMLLFNSCFIDK